MGAPMEFKALGPLEIIDNAREITPTAPKLRAVLALLVLRNDRGVQIDELMDELWGEKPPVSALPTLQTYIYQLRKLLAPGQRENGDLTLRTWSHGYRLVIPEGSLDISSFDRLVKAGEAALTEDDPERATTLLSEALSLWRGSALANVDIGPILSAHVAGLEESRLRALELRLDADLIRGNHHALIGEIKALVPSFPLHEGLHARLMVSLHRAGRRYEALDVFQTLRRTLIQELGLEPSAELQRVHQAVLTSDPALDERVQATEPRPQPPLDRSVTPAPAQLPSDLCDFTGRADTLRRLEELLVLETGQSTAVPVISIVGPPGVGKTAVAVHVAHELADFFPSGQLFARLGGTDTEPADPREVLGGFLSAARIPFPLVPDGVQERSMLFRSWCAEREVLLVLDDAASWTQIEPLLPGGGQCAVIATTRLHTLPLTKTVRLGLIDDATGLELLTNIVGAERIALDPPAAQEIVACCGGLPLAIRAAGARLAASPGWTPAKLAKRLADPRTRLSELRVGELDVRAAHDPSFRKLGLREASAFRLLSLLPPRFTAALAGELLGLDPDDAETLLERLAESHLLIPVSEADPLYYTLPELTRIYARERLEELTAGWP